MRYYSFETSFYDKDDDQTVTETGIIAGENYSAAIADLIEYYGEEGLEELKVAPLSDCPLLVSKDAIKEIAEKVIW